MLKVHFYEKEIFIQIEEFDDKKPKHKTIAQMLEKAKFIPLGTKAATWKRTDDLPKWYEQCRALVDKVGGEIIDYREELEEKGNSAVPFLSKEPEGQIAEERIKEERIKALEIEVKRLGELGAIAENELQRLESLLKSLR